MYLHPYLYFMPEIVRFSKVVLLIELAIALDPGVRTFLTGFDGSDFIEIGKNDISRNQKLSQ